MRLKVVGSAVAAVGAAVVTAVEALPSPDGFWPTTATGWFSFGGYLVGMVVGAVAFFKWWSAPTEKKIAEAEARMTKALEESAKACSAELNRHSESVKLRLDGMGGRIEQVEEETRENHTTTESVLQSMVEHRADRRHMGESLARIESGLTAMQKQYSEGLGEIIRIVLSQRRTPPEDPR